MLKKNVQKKIKPADLKVILISQIEAWPENIWSQIKCAFVFNFEW